jgi:hypothetical protein
MTMIIDYVNLRAPQKMLRRQRDHQNTVIIDYAWPRSTTTVVFFQPSLLQHRV